MVTEIKGKGGYIPPRGVSLSVENLLNQLVDDRRKELEGWQEQLLSLKTRKDILRSLQLTPSFRQRYTEAIRFHLLPHSDDELRGFRNRLAGAEFAEAARLYCQSVQQPSTMVLSAEQTIIFYQRLYPNSHRIRQPLGLDSLDGISVPDAMVVEKNKEKTRILAVGEFTLSGERDDYIRHCNGFLIYKKHFPKLFDGTHLLFVTPKEAHLPTHIVRIDGVELVELPFIHPQFRNYLDSLYGFYRLDQDSATLNEMQKWVREQFNRIQKL